MEQPTGLNELYDNLLDDADPQIRKAINDIVAKTAERSGKPVSKETRNVLALAVLTAQALDMAAAGDAPYAGLKALTMITAATLAPYTATYEINRKG